MIYLLTALFAVACCNLAIAIVYLSRRKSSAARAEPKLHPASYNLALRDAGEILRDIRVELGVQVGECYVIEEGLDRIRKCFK
jgi:hypothetical protein